MTRSARASTFAGIVRLICLAALQIDEELKLLRLLYREIGGLGAFQDFVHIRRGAAEQVGDAHGIDHKAAFFDKFCTGVCRREPVFYRKFQNLCSVRVEDEARKHEDCVSTLLGCGAECSLNILGIYDV